VGNEIELFGGALRNFGGGDRCNSQVGQADSRCE